MSEEAYYVAGCVLYYILYSKGASTNFQYHCSFCNIICIADNCFLLLLLHCMEEEQVQASASSWYVCSHNCS